ncbi:LLM class flavin-dependent oxidoreductase [Curvibacter sp. HBC28]|uniref:LLM class flavin-dependent oxidoreductase n=1 Tax=Curvibacter microcysteis TaxID=3026419 RepID=A0ABT5MHU2_9BURK|nr:MupA/Atu3671 family FMN-dependent luciferase-like monooxygenase [Curvibacter sp. HBC28]MDD0814755.1 LLM class flavin-dependent oxidoreductase [Curvibacter sp. HBC28]
MTDIKTLQTFTEVLPWRAQTCPDDLAYAFYSEDLSQRQDLSYRELHQRALALAGRLAREHAPGERVLMLFAPGLSFALGFWACLYAGLLPMPVYPPNRQQRAERLLAIARDAQASGVLTTAALAPKCQVWLDTALAQHDFALTVVDEDIAEVDPAPPSPSGAPGAIRALPHRARPEDPVFIQYTSGSTGAPKGVVVTQRSLVHNQHSITEGFALSRASIGVSWLPMYHDMGLVGGLLNPVFTGYPVHLMEPMAFMRRPATWLDLLSATRATVSGAPDFAYALCVRKLSEADCAGLDLSAWTLAFSGAEPVRARTLAAFADRFSPVGFRAQAFCPCYGMAEATLFISARRGGVALPVASDTHAPAPSAPLGAAQLASAEVGSDVRPDGAASARAWVSCGQPVQGTQLITVDPDTLRPVPEGQVGEIWVRGDSVAAGYWAQPEASQAAFAAHTADGQGPFLRTGDLGLLAHGELCVTGRLKDLIILRGRNCYPHDIEDLVQACDHALTPQRVAAFSAELDGEEKLVVVAELTRQALRQCQSENGVALADAVVARMQAALGEALGLSLAQVLLLKPGHLPLTSSGKVRRSTCRQAWLDQQLAPVHQWPAAAAAPGHRLRWPDPPEASPGAAPAPAAAVPALDGAGPPQPGAVPRHAPDSAQRAQALIDWLRGFASRHLNSALMDERRSLSPHVVLALGNQGILGMSIPTEWGGLGLRDEDSLRVIQQLGAIDLSLAAFVGVHLALGAGPLLSHGSPAQKAQWLPALASGRQLAAFALTEPGAGSNPRQLQALARPTALGWSLTGEKCWIGNAAWSQVITVFAQTEAGPGAPLGMSAFLVSADNPGLHMGPEALTMGMRGMVQNALSLRQAPLADDALLGIAGRGFEVAQAAMCTGRLGIAAMSVGALQRCAQLLLRYASARTVNTGRLLDNPVTRERLHWITQAATAVSAWVQALAQARDQGQDWPDEAYAVAKIAGPECLGQAVDWLMQGLGGRGYIESNGVPQLLRDARLLRIFEGPTETLQMHLGLSLMHQAEGLLKLFEQSLQAPLAAQRLRSLRDRGQAWLDAAEPAAGGRAVSTRSLAWHLGRIVVWLALGAVLEGPRGQLAGAPARSAQAWARREEDRLTGALDDALRHTREAGAAGLEAQIEAFAEAIGDVHPRLPGEDHGRDPLLFPGDAVAPSAPSTLWAAQAPGLGPEAAASPAPPPAAEPGGDAQAQALCDWLCAWLARELKVPLERVDPQQSLMASGLDSLSATECALALEAHLGRPVSMDLFWEAGSVAALAQCLCQDPLAKTGPEAGAEVVVPTSAPVAPPSSDLATAGLLARAEASETPATPGRWGPMAAGPSLSVFFFGGEQGRLDADQAYALIIDCARLADEAGFEAIWTPERHFHAFGGHFPNPSVLGAALARETRRIDLRAGSVVLPLHHPARVAEEWALVDRLSGGRAGVAVTPGWSPKDFLLQPQAHAARFEALPEQVDLLRRLWSGESVSFVDAHGQPVQTQTYPRPVQPELPLWLTCNRRVEGFAQAGALGARVLTALLSQTLEELAQKIGVYREALQAHGHAPQRGRVTLMLHTYVADDLAQAREDVRQPLTDYLRSSVDLWQQGSTDLASLSEAAREQLLSFAFERYLQHSALIGPPDHCQRLIDRVHAAGVDEIACLLDFGLGPVQIKASLQRLAGLQRAVPLGQPAPAPAAAPLKAALVPGWGRVLHQPPQSRGRLICFPAAGEDASMFEAWRAAGDLPFEILALQWPDHLDELEALMAELMPRLQPLCQGPYAFYGHSLGAWVAFEAARRLADQGRPPVRLFAAAQHAPHGPCPHPAPEALHTPAGRAWAEALLRGPGGEAAHLSEAAWQRVLTRVTPGLRLQTQRAALSPAAVQPWPITALHGAHDRLLTPAAVQAWCDWGSAGSTFTVVDGAHLFLRTQARSVLDAVGRQLTQDLA